MEVRLTIPGTGIDFNELRRELFTVPEEGLTGLNRLSTEPHTDELYQSLADQCFPLGNIIGQFNGLEEVMPILNGVSRGLYISMVAFNQIQQKLVETVSPDINLPKQLSLVAAERYAQAMVVKYGGSLPRSNVITNEINTLVSLLAINNPEEVAELGSTMTLQFGSEVLTALTMKETLEGYSLKYRERQEATHLKVENDALFENSRILQKYQLKPALVAGSGAGGVNDWMVINWDDMMREIEESLGYGVLNTATPEILARLFGTKKQFISGKPAFERHGSGNNQFYKVNFTNAIKGSHEGELPSVNLQLGSDGTLKGTRGSSFEEFAKHIGKSAEYELLRGEVLSIYCDLVVPAHLINEIEEIEKQVLNVRNGKPRDVHTIRRIVLARVRLLNERNKEVLDEIKKEQRKRPEEHDVIGFIRALPTGSRATAEQRELCRRDLNKELAESGETYVRNHKRGGHQDETVERATQGHRAIRRHVGGGIVHVSGVDRPTIL